MPQLFLIAIKDKSFVNGAQDLDFQPLQVLPNVQWSGIVQSITKIANGVWRI